MYLDIGMSANEIVSSPDWDSKPTLADVEQIVAPLQRSMRFNPIHLSSLRRNAASKYLEFGGQKLTIAEWALALRIPSRTIYTRVRRGWSAQRALTENPRRTP
jgi:hypothetical protein